MTLNQTGIIMQRIVSHKNFITKDRLSVLPVADNRVASVSADALLIFSTQPRRRSAARRLGYGPLTVNTFLS